MSESIWKYQLDVGHGIQTLDVPRAAVFLPTAQMQDGRLTLWAIVSPEQPKEERLIQTVFTGFTLPRTVNRCGFSNYIGTVQDGPIVAHVFDCGRAP